MNNKISKNLKGDWDIPIFKERDFNNNFLIKVSMIKPAQNDKEEDKVIDEKIIDYGNFNHRKFLGRFSFYAWTNGYLIETIAVGIKN